MQSGGIKRSVGDTACGVDVGVWGEIEFSRDCDIKGSKELGWFCMDVVRVNMEFDSGIHGMNLGCCGLGTLGCSQYALFPTIVLETI